MAATMISALTVILSVTSHMARAQYFGNSMWPGSVGSAVSTTSLQTGQTASSSSSGNNMMGSNVMGNNMMGNNMMGMNMMGGNMFPGFPFMQGNAGPMPRALKCEASRGPTSFISVTISERSQQGMGMGMGMPGLLGLGMPLSPMYGAFSMLGAGFGMDAGGLQADVRLSLDTAVPNAVLALTEFSGSPLDACDAATYGPVLHDPMSAAMSGFAGMQMFGMPGFGPGMFGPNPLNTAVNAAGIVKEVNIQSQTTQNVRVTLSPELTIERLAGRGFVVCDSVSYDFNGSPVCDDPIRLCCGLTYSSG